MVHIKQQILSLFILLLLIPSITFAEKLTLGAPEDVVPFVYQQDDQLTGIDVDIGRKIFERLGMELEVKVYPMKRLVRYLKNGKVDGVLGLFKIDFKETFSDSLDRAPECMYFSKVAMYARKDRKLSVSNPADLTGKSVGTLGGYLFSSELEQVEWLERVEALSLENLVQRLEKGRIDVTVMEDKPFWFYSRKHDFQDQFEEVYTVRESSICMGFSKKALGLKSKVIADRVGDIVNQLKAEGEIEKIINQYK